jgi:prephenate dehydratase
MSCLILFLAASAYCADLGFLGPRGTFSDQAAETYRQRTPGLDKTVPFENMTAIVDALAAGRIASGIIPVASTVAGFPAESASILLCERQPGFRVVGEVVVPVELHLLVKAGTPRSHVARIVSHPSALKEAGAFLRANYAAIPQEESESTAAAAERVAKSDGSLAAVASAAAARLYNLEILERAIQENPENATSFWAIARAPEAPAPGLADRLVIRMDVPAGSPALSMTIAKLQEAGFAVVFINSTPLPGKLYGFRYLISFAADKPVAAQLIASTLNGSIQRLGWYSQKK